MLVFTESRFRHLLLAGACVLSLTACGEIEYAYDRTHQGVGDAYSSVFTSDKPAKTSPTKVEVIVPEAASYQDVTKREITMHPPASQLGADEAVVLGSMRAPADRSLGAPSATASSAPTPMIAAKQPVTAPTVVAMDKLGAPLMVIRFNQHHVHYEDALTRVVRTAEAARPTIVYNVVSHLPDLSPLPAAQRDDISSRAMANLRNVVMHMQQHGVPADRIRIASQQKNVSSQEIAIFVN